MQELLKRLARHESGAFGLFGPEHIGKRRLAEGFVRQALGLSEQEALITHPDVVVLDAAQEGKVEEIRTLLERVHQTAARGGKRLFFVDHADALNVSGYNALLKDVEEPRPGVLFFFVASREAALPATVRSRLIPLRLGLASHEELLALACERGINEGWVDQVLGRPGLLLRRAQDPAWWEGVTETVRRIDEALRDRRAGSLIAALDTWQKTIEKHEYPAQQWRILLLLLMQAATRRGGDVSGYAYVQAWRLLEGSALPPRVGIEFVLATLLQGEPVRDIFSRSRV